MRTAILQQNIGDWASVAVAGFPFATLRVAVDQATLLSVGSTMEICVIELAFFASGRFHVVSILDEMKGASSKSTSNVRFQGKRTLWG